MTFNPDDAGTTIFGDKKFPELKHCSVRHDKDYVEQIKTRKRADTDFRDCMEKVVAACKKPERKKQLKMAVWQRYWGVRMLGWIMWYT